MSAHEMIKAVTAAIESHRLPDRRDWQNRLRINRLCPVSLGRLIVRLDHNDPPFLYGVAGRWIYEEQLDAAGLDGCIDDGNTGESTTITVTFAPTTTGGHRSGKRTPAMHITQH